MASGNSKEEAREGILHSIRQALSDLQQQPAIASEVAVPASGWYVQEADDPLLLFAEKFTELSGQFAYCTHWQEVTQNLQALLAYRGWSRFFCADLELQQRLVVSGFKGSFTPDLCTCDAAITGVEALVARTGSLLLSSAQAHGRTASAYAPAHIAIALAGQVVYDLEDAFRLLQEKYGAELPSFITVASGPSRTADIEKTLVTGVHGPGAVYCLVVEA